MRPRLYRDVEIVTRTLGAPLGFGLSVSVHLVLGGDLDRVHGTLHQGGVGHHGLLVGVVVGEVPHETNSVPNGIEPPGMCTLYIPPSSFVNITISSD